MPKLRILDVTGQSNPRLRLLQVDGAGAVYTVPRLRLLHVAGGGQTATVVNPIPSPGTVDPLTTISLSASLVGGETADTYTWRQVPIAGQTTYPITFHGTGDARTFDTPATATGATVRVGVVATKDSVTSPEVFVDTVVLPQIRWYIEGGTWRPYRVAA